MNSFGRIFRVSLYGESHGPQVGALIDGCPPGIEIAPEDFEADLSRRRAGAKGTTPRIETDRPQLQSGIYKGRTTGTPILIGFANKEARPGDYSKIENLPRPGHADLTGRIKYRGYADPRGGGHFSGRLTVGLVAAGTIAKKILPGVVFNAALVEAGGSEDIEAAVVKAMAESDSIGGLIRCRVSGLPAGLGEPFFDSLESVLAHGLFAIPGIRGVSFGAGFSSAKMQGSEFNDRIVDKSGISQTNNAGGVLGGITTGNDLEFEVAVRPAASIGMTQQTIDLKTGESAELKLEGRHDACIALRVPVIVEVVAAICLADLWLIHKCGSTEES